MAVSVYATESVDSACSERELSTITIWVAYVSDSILEFDNLGQPGETSIAY